MVRALVLELKGALVRCLSSLVDSCRSWYLTPQRVKKDKPARKRRCVPPSLKAKSEKDTPNDKKRGRPLPLSIVLRFPLICWRQGKQANARPLSCFRSGKVCCSSDTEELVTAPSQVRISEVVLRSDLLPLCSFAFSHYK